MYITRDDILGMYYYIEELHNKKDKNNNLKYAIWIPFCGTNEDIHIMQNKLDEFFNNGVDVEAINAVLGNEEKRQTIFSTYPATYILYNSLNHFANIMLPNDKNTGYFSTFRKVIKEEMTMSISGEIITFYTGVFKLITTDKDFIKHLFDKRFNIFDNLLADAEYFTAQFIWFSNFFKLSNYKIYGDNIMIEGANNLSEKKRDKLINKINKDRKKLGVHCLKKLKDFKESKKSKLYKVNVVPPENLSMYYNHFEDIWNTDEVKLLKNVANKKELDNLFSEYEFSSGEKLVLQIINEEEKLGNTIE